MSKSENAPTNSELEILTVLWEIEQGTAREVHEQLSRVKSTGYTTTLKIIQNMYEKELLSREPKGQTHIYAPAVRKEQIQRNLLGGFVNKVFGGSSKQLIIQALGNDQPTPEELDEIRAMLDKIEKDNS